MLLMDNPLPRICFGCTFCNEPECSLLHKHISDKYLYDEKPEWCPWVPSEKEGWITIDYEKVPEDTVLDLGFLSVDTLTSIREIGDDDDDEI